ncbi:MAG: DUF4091 domain-containing protein, partial [Acidobacteria bacterium]|nr:DUF4091 domain-containing protein [Acidobacteriota bacterium]
IAAQSQQFNATVTGTANTAVTWTLSGPGCAGATCGTITAGGLYTAPVVVPAPATVTVTATSVADPTKSGTGTATIIAAVVVNVSPLNPGLSTGSSLTFTATVTGSANTAVNWSVNGIAGGNSSIGTINAAGLYSSPAIVPTPNTVTITATSQADPTKSSSTTLTISAGVVVSVTPPSVTLTNNPQGSQLFVATVSGTANTAVNWSLSGAGCAGATCGTITPGGLYTAPALVPVPGTVTVTATSVADPTKTGTASVTLNATITVSVLPNAPTIALSASQPFAATVVGSANTAVNWSVDGIPGGNAAVGTINAAGTYTAPSSLAVTQNFTITASSQANPASTGSATVTVNVPVVVTVGPGTANVTNNLTTQFSATVTGTANTAVNWTLSGAGCAGATCGTISAAGLYTAPAAVPAPATVTVTAASQANPASTGTATVTVLAPIAVSVSPVNPTIITGALQPFTATVTGGTGNTAVTWTVNGISGGNSTVGTIDAAGNYTAPISVPTPNTVTIRATSVADPTKSGSTTATINPPVAVTISPSGVSLNAPGGAQTFVATVTGTGNTAVTWSVQGIPGGNATFGTIDAAGNYAAPAVVPGTNPVTVTATSVADNTKSSSASVTLSATISVSVSPTGATLQVGATQTFTATVTGAAPTITWLVNGVPGGNATVGTITVGGFFTAPATVPAGGTVTVTAQQDATHSASATVTITPVISVSVAPCAGATCGTISATGSYTAPAAVPSPATVTVTATSVADNTKSGTATVTVQPGVTVSVNPPTATLVPNGPQTFTATVTGTGNTVVTWSVNGVNGGNSSVGTITAGGAYTAPASVPTPNTVTVTATSQADPTKSANATVTINAAIAVSVTPASVSLTNNPQGTRQFTATVTGTANTAVTWTLSGAGCAGAACGTITAGGLYTAPALVPVPASVTVTATSSADPTKTGTATVTLTTTITVSVTPPAPSIGLSATQLFTATVVGSANTAVNWSVNGIAGGNAAVGTISAAGLYTAPVSLPSAQNFTITAASQVNPASTGSATVTVGVSVAVSVAPSAANVPAGQNQQFTATVTGTGNTAVNWSLSGAGCSGATCGTVTAAGLYTAPNVVPTPSVVTVTATSQADPTKSSTASITVSPAVVVTVSPTTAFPNTSQTQQFTASVTGSANTAVTWAVNGVSGGNSSVGTITATGFYTAPAATPNPAAVTVTATSSADPTKSGSAIVTISTPPIGVFVTVFPVGKNLPAGKTQKFTAHVIRSNNPTVTWAVNGIAGGNASVGTIDATGLYTPPSTPSSLPLSITITATSQADPTAFKTVNAKVVASVTVSPASVKMFANTTQQFTAAVAGTANQAVAWFVNGIAGGNGSVGSISATGLYTAPGPVQSVVVSATSTVDPSEPGVATITTTPRIVLINPGGQTVLPGGHIQFRAWPSVLPQPIFNQPLLNWSVNGVIGGSASTGTITSGGLYVAPATPQSVTIAATSTVDPTRNDSVVLTVAAPASASQVGLLTTQIKVRPYDQVVLPTSPNVTVAGNQYASMQVLIDARNEDLTGVDVSVSTFNNGAGGQISASNATVYLEKYINVSQVTRSEGDTGEWPDPLIPKVDPFVGQTRNAFPFKVNRVSPAYKIFPTAGGDTVNTNTGAGRAVSGGTYSATVFKQFVVQIEQTGTVSSAKFKWSNDSGVTFVQTGLSTSTNPVALSDGVTVSFAAGGVAGVSDFVAGDQFWIFGGPLRNQPVWIDVFVPGSTPAGTYNGTITVTRSGKPSVNLTMPIVVLGHVIPVSSSIPNYVGMNWTDLLNAHFQIVSGPQTLQLGQLYGTACLINRLSCDTSAAFPPTFTFNADGTVATSNYTAYDQATAPLANGTITPHGEQLSSLRLPRAGVTDSQTYFATQNMLTALTTRGWRTRVFDFSFDEPGTAGEFQGAMDRTSLVRSVDPTVRAAVTTDIANVNYNLVGYVNRWVPQWSHLDRKEFLDGPNNSSRGFYDSSVALGDDIWWYDSCLTHGCAMGTTPRHDDYPSLTADSSALQNRVWGLLGIYPYRVTGFLHQDSVLAYSRFFNMSQPKIDVWDSIYYQGGNGDGTLFYPGRPANIGGTTDIPIESMRLKFIRDALVDQEESLFLQQGNQTLFVQSTIANANALSLYSYTQNPSAQATASLTMVTQ